MTIADGDLDPDPRPEVAVVLVTSEWAAPARPAATVLRELARRWGPSVHALSLDDASDEVLELLEIENVPTWLQLRRAGSEEGPRNSTAQAISDLRAADLAGDHVVLSGIWMLTHRRTGALPKHIVAEEFGPNDGTTS